MTTQSKSDNPQFTWINFYKDLAGELLRLRDHRGILINIINTLGSQYVNYLLDKKTNKCKFSDIDPFSIFAMFNRGLGDEKRIDIIKVFKDEFHLKSSIPLDFAGIPVVNNNRSYFFADEKTDIERLWDLFEAAFNYPNDNRFIDLFDKVIKQKGVYWMVTMALYWIRPDAFIPLDKYTQAFLDSKGIQIIPKGKLTGQSYLDLINALHNNSQFKNLEFQEISLEAWLRNHQSNEDRGLVENRELDPIISKVYDLLQFKKNVILQGAPGTGKTYLTAEIALQILGVDYDHDEIMEKYNEYKDKERIFFTTFHQSMDYEDFVEGLKPEITKDSDDNPIGVTYNISKGIFRKVCEAANKLIAEKLLCGIKRNPTIWKINIGKLCSLSGSESDSIRTDCLSNNYICLPNEGISKDTSVQRSYLNYLQNVMDVGDIVLSSVSSHEINAIGIVTGEFEKHTYNKAFPYYRKVQWIVKDISENIVSINQGKNIATPWFHRFPNISRKGVLEIINKYIQRKIPDINNDDIDNKAAVVLIIDEINRGNVSKIFGELVTLLEKDKREGDIHSISVTLPYSKKEFSVPSNVYIIGTMNTTDRSTGTLDYAIRRRFAFVTLPADREAIQLDIAKELFDDIELFIEDNCPKDMDIADLMVGHSYFMTEDEDELELKIKYEVVPLLKEYCNDGLLTCSQEELNERIEAWENLEVFDDSSVETEDEDNEEDEDQE